MEVTIKNIKFYESMSDETNCFQCDVYVDGKKCGYGRNDGRGGSTNVQPYLEKRFEFNECNTWLKNQPQINIGTIDDPYLIDCDLESTVDNLFEKWLEEKEKKKLEKKMVDRIMWGVPNGYSYTEVKFKKPINQIEHNILQRFLDKYKLTFKEGETFLNTNLEGFNL